MGNSLGRSLFVCEFWRSVLPLLTAAEPASEPLGACLCADTYGPSHDGSDGNTPLGVIRSETFGCSQTQVEPCGHSVLGYDTIELFVISEVSSTPALSSACKSLWMMWMQSERSFLRAGLVRDQDGRRVLRRREW